MKSVSFLLTLAAAVLALALAGCGGEDGQEAATQTETQAQEDEEASPPGNVTVTMDPQGDFEQNGEAELTEIDENQTRVVLQLDGNPEGADAQPAHIHQGTCDSPGDVVHPLSNVEGGQSETTVDASLEELTGGDMSINVHLSQAEIETYTSCGDIPAQD